MNRDYGLDILCRMLDALKLDDVVLSYDKDGVLQAEDSEGNRWRGADFYRFLTTECLCFTDGGALSEGQYVEVSLLDRYKELTAVYGVPAGKYGVQRHELVAEHSSVEAFIQGHELTVDYGENLPKEEHEAYEMALSRRQILENLFGNEPVPERSEAR